MDWKTRFTIPALATLVCLALACSKSSTGGDDDDDDPIDDTDAPAAIMDLHVISITTSSMTLAWTAPGDDGNVGCAYQYDLRASHDTITEATFSAAFQITDIFPPAPAGTAQVYTVDSLEPGETYYFAMKTRDQMGNWSGLSNCCHDICPLNVPIVFADSVFERIVREHIHMPAGDIYSSDVDTVTQLSAEDQNITALGGVEYFLNLVFLHLIGNHVADLSPVAGLSNLRVLNLAGNSVADLTPITGLTGLTGLFLSDCPITSLAPIAGLVNLTSLSLQTTPSVDLSPIYGMTKLQDLWLNNKNLVDIGFFAGRFPALRSVVLSGNHIVDLTPLAGRTNLQELYLGFNDVVNVTPLQGLTGLTVLSLPYNDIVDIAPLVANTGLGPGDEVQLQQNPLSETSINTHIPALEMRGVIVSH